MITTEIYIENQKLDLYKDISSEFTYNIDDVKDFSARNTNFSKTIVLPGNATDRKSTRLNSSHIPLSRMPSSA